MTLSQLFIGLVMAFSVLASAEIQDPDSSQPEYMPPFRPDGVYRVFDVVQGVERDDKTKIRIESTKNGKQIQITPVGPPGFLPGFLKDQELLTLNWVGEQEYFGAKITKNEFTSSVTMRPVLNALAHKMEVTLKSPHYASTTHELIIKKLGKKD